MTWYAAHLISYVKFVDGIQDRYPIWENVVLIQADTDDAAYAAADRIGRGEYDGTDFAWEGRPATWSFAGIRKMIECQNIASAATDRHDPVYRPGHGTELTYSQLQLDTAHALQKLIDGDAVAVLYEE